jgi:hypothetical protein
MAPRIGVESRCDCAHRIVIELDEAKLDELSAARRQEVHDLARVAWTDRRDLLVTFAPYRRGSAFLRAVSGS